MKVYVNGQPHETAAGATINTLLSELEIIDRRVAVEVNQQIVPRAEHAGRPLAPDDRVEIVSLVGGG